MQVSPGNNDYGLKYTQIILYFNPYLISISSLTIYLIQDCTCIRQNVYCKIHLTISKISQDFDSLSKCLRK